MADFKAAIEKYMADPATRADVESFASALAIMSVGDRAEAEYGPVGKTVRISFIAHAADPKTGRPLLRVGQDDHPFRPNGTPISLHDAAAEMACVINAYAGAGGIS